MGAISHGQYSSRVRVDAFKGLYQDGDEHDVDPSYAAEAANASTRGGQLQTVSQSVVASSVLDKPIGTLMRLHRRYHVDLSGRDVLIAASGGRLYWKLLDDAHWSDVALPAGVEAFQSDTWSWATYEINPEGSDAPVDVLLLSNAVDGMAMVRGDTMTAETVETPRKFGVISRYAERIWGGAIPDDPDMLAYSAPFDPTDWTINTAIPEDGAGDIMQPSWDGDSFTMLTPFGSQLIALKKTRVWRILGVSPGEYVFKEQYGGGAVYARTVVVDSDRILMLSEDGLLQYDGYTVEPYYRQYARDVFRRMNLGALSGACACRYKNSYFLALPLDGGEVNNAVLELNTEEKTWLLHEGVTVRDFLPLENGLYFTNATVPGQVWRWGADRWEGRAMPLRWISPWLTFDRLDMRKGGWVCYLCAYAETATEIQITVRTEKKRKTKTLRVQPPSGDRGPMIRKLTFGGAGRRWRFEIESRGTVPWKLNAGMQWEVETDPD